MRQTTLPLLLLAVACGDKDDTGSDDTAAGAPVETSCTATVDGAAWEAASEASFWASYHADSLSISCAVADGSSGILIHIAGYTGAGSYTLDGGQTYAQVIGGAMSAEPGAWVSTTGSVEITRDDGVAVVGTFAFDGTDASVETTKSVTGGSFAVNEGG